MKTIIAAAAFLIWCIGFGAGAWVTQSYIAEHQKVLVVEVEQRPPLVNKRISLSGEGVFIRPEIRWTEKKGGE